jgi:hypothetical protein
MAVYSSKDVGFLLVGGYSLLGQTTTITEDLSTVLENTTSLGDAWHEFSPVGVSRASISQGGFFDDTADSVNTALVTLAGTSRVLSYTVEGNTVGKKFVGFSGTIQSKYERIASLNAVHRANASHSGSGIVEEGVILHALGARTSDGDSTGADSIDDLALSSNGGSGFLHVVAYSGFSSVVFKVLHDTDDSGYADLITFATVSGITAERKTVSGTVNRYLACSWDVTGSGSVTFMIGFKRNP